MHYRLQACLRTLGISGTPRWREACASGARYLRIFGNLFTDSPPVPPSVRSQTRLSYEQNCFPVGCRSNKRKNSQIIKQAVPEIHEEGDEIRFGNFKGVSMKLVKRFFVYKCKLSVSLALLWLAELFINKLKTKFNSFFYRMVLNTERNHNSFWRNFPQRAKQMPSKVLFFGKKTRRPFGHYAPKL